MEMKLKLEIRQEKRAPGACADGSAAEGLARMIYIPEGHCRVIRELKEEINAKYLPVIGSRSHVKHILTHDGFILCDWLCADAVLSAGDTAAVVLCSSGCLDCAPPAGRQAASADQDNEAQHRETENSAPGGKAAEERAPADSVRDAAIVEPRSSLDSTMAADGHRKHLKMQGKRQLLKKPSGVLEKYYPAHPAMDGDEDGREEPLNKMTFLKKLFDR